MSEPLHFVPWVRRGLGLELGDLDEGQISLPRSAPVAVRVELDGQPATATLALRPADHATAIDAAQIIRRYPAPNTMDAEWGYFPLVELSAPDLPWTLTPAVADDEAAGRLRPWIVLVCVEDEAAELIPGDADRPARLIVPVEQLPDLAESHAWAHVQSVAPPAELVASMSDAPGTVVARLVCPRRLSPAVRYRAAVVLAFSASGDALTGAWDLAKAKPGRPELTLFDTWTFTTGEASSFEELCRRLGPVGDETLQLGLHSMDVTHLGSVDPWPRGTRRVTVDYTGGLWDADLAPEQLGTLNDDFDAAVTKLLDQGSHRVAINADDPDPVVTPPLFGSFAPGTHAVPDEGWMRQLNLGPNRRAAAGLGAELVRIHQERFMAASWLQAGALREANRELSRGRLQAEIGRTWLGRANRLTDLQRVTVLRSQLSFVRDDSGQPPRRVLRESTVPGALASPAYLRQTRPGAVVAAAADGRSEESPSWQSAVATSFGSAATRDAMRFAEVGIPEGTTIFDPRREGDPTIPPDFDDELPERFGAEAGARTLAADDLDLADIAGLTTEIAPVATARDRVQARIPALAPYFAAAALDAMPTRVRWGPVIDEALVWSLVELSPELLLPGVALFPQNAVRVVETNTAFVASLLAGANHEMKRELLWREFPADLGSTTFHRFWDRPDREDRDIDPMSEWTDSATLAQLGAADGESVVLLIRGDLVMHYPTVRVLLVDPATDIASLPSFSGWIAPDVRFAAFSVEEADVVTAAGSRWKVVLEEQPCEPRFGLDTGSGTERLLTWSDLTWEHLTAQGDAIHLVVGSDGFPVDQPEPEGATWGLNSAHMARAVYQAPFRRLFDVVDLVGPSS